MVVQTPHNIQAHTARVGKILPLTQRQLPGADRGIPVAESHEIHAGIVSRAQTQRSCRAPRIAGGTVLPLRYADFGGRLGADIIHIVDGQFRADAAHGLNQPLPLCLGAGGLESGILAVIRVAGIIAVGNIQAVLLLEQALAVFAVAGAVVHAAVIHHEETAHIAEYTVKGVDGQDLPQDFQRFLFLVSTVGAGLNVAVIVDDVPVFVAVGPIGMLGKHALAQLGKIHPRNNADAALMAGADDFA